MDLVEIHQNRIVTSSLQIAELFEKQHKNIMQRIERSTAENSALLEHVMKSEYTASNGKSNPMYYLDRDAFSYIVMGFTGTKAADWKWKYIQAFNEMERKLRNPYENQIPQTLPEALIAYAHALQENEKLEAANQKLTEDTQRMAPKEEYYDALCAAGANMPLQDAAKALGLRPRKEFLPFLLDRGMLFHKNGRIYPYQEFVDKEYFVLKQRQNGDWTGTQTMVSVKGLQEFHKIVPDIIRMYRKE